MNGIVTVVTVVYNVPYVRYVVLVEVIMVALGSVKSYYIVLSTACDHYEIRSLIGIAPLP